MKVLLTSDIDFPVSRSLKHAGIQRVVYALATELQRLGVEVTVCSTGDSDEMGGALFATVERALHSQPPLPSMPIDYSGGASDLRSEIILESPYNTEAHQKHYRSSLQRAISEGVDIVHDHGGGLLLSDAYREYQNLLHMTILTTLHGAVTADGHLDECGRYKQLARHNVFFSCVSRHQAQLYGKHLNVSGIVHNSVSLDDYHLQSQKKDYLFSLGRIMRRKGQDIAVEVAERAGQMLVLAGPIMEPHYFDEFRSRVRIRPRIGRIPVTPSYLAEVVEPLLVPSEPAVYIGQLNDMQKDVWFGHASGFLMPIRWDEPFGLVLIEAMACGTPVITFNRGGVSEVIADGQTGFIVDSPNEMVEAVGKLDQIDPAQCRKHVEQHFSSQAMGQKYLELYGQLLTSAS